MLVLNSRDLREKIEAGFYAQNILKYDCLSKNWTCLHTNWKKFISCFSLNTNKPYLRKTGKIHVDNTRITVHQWILNKVNILTCREIKKFKFKQHFVYLSSARLSNARRVSPVSCYHAGYQLSITNLLVWWRFIHGTTGSAFIFFASLWCSSHNLLWCIEMGACTWIC